MTSFSNKGYGWYTYGSKTKILATMPSVAMNSESVTGNVAFRCPHFRIRCDTIGLIIVVCKLIFLNGKVTAKSWQISVPGMMDNRNVLK